MTRKAVVRRSQAQKDIEQAADHYFAEGGTALELRFINALHAAVTRIATNPGSGRRATLRRLQFRACDSGR